MFFVLEIYKPFALSLITLKSFTLIASKSKTSVPNGAFLLNSCAK
ncbi:hypothetical protein NWE60_00820 [Mycoplasmopsis felis]|nr:hypothetical protein [Mycoplasmopsis felis]MCU9931245.1 hypothetical protein [Mycoplasmopsis felis]MCU9937496.1 hypothetical protein [Mycoplasmopsis felis]UWV79951.1 hypothetical protein NW072_02260 [Mycoplasmopsis felis]UWW00808.1 hypothetical protein NW064_06545 [Mycoplasmopsis felis]WAM01204.1 hypothetical protein NWE60_00820 [Mycoplasmopsis felis]